MRKSATVVLGSSITIDSAGSGTGAGGGVGCGAAVGGASGRRTRRLARWRDGEGSARGAARGGVQEEGGVGGPGGGGRRWVRAKVVKLRVLGDGGGVECELAWAPSGGGVRALPKTLRLSKHEGPNWRKERVM